MAGDEGDGRREPGAQGRILVRPAVPGSDTGALARVLADCVGGGASVGFMAPLDEARAERFWLGVLESAGSGERIVLVAQDRDSGDVVGTVQVVLQVPENQPHRGELAKMLVHRGARRRGVGEALLLAAERAARGAGKTLLVLDTASADAERLYHRVGWRRVGVIPGYALGPRGGFVDTVVFYRDLSS